MDNSIVSTLLNVLFNSPRENRDYLDKKAMEIGMQPIWWQQWIGHELRGRILTIELILEFSGAPNAKIQDEMSNIYNRISLRSFPSISSLWIGSIILFPLSLVDIVWLVTPEGLKEVKSDN